MSLLAKHLYSFHALLFFASSDWVAFKLVVCLCFVEALSLYMGHYLGHRVAHITFIEFVFPSWIPRIRILVLCCELSHAWLML